MNRKFILVLALVGFFVQVRSWADEDEDGEVLLAHAIVKIEAMLRQSSHFEPWKMGNTEIVTGTGVIVDFGGPHILTCSHLVANAKQINVRPHQSNVQHSATVVATAPGMDLALLKVNDHEVFSQFPMLPLADELTNVGKELRVYGYPTGNDLSETKGVVSLIEYNTTYFGQSGVMIRLDKTLDAGNYGGPAVADGQVAGITYFGDGDNDVSFLVSSWEIKLFLKDINDGTYDGKPILMERFQPLNTALRTRLGIDMRVSGVVLGQLDQNHLDTPLQRWDVITHIANHAIDNRGMVRVGNDLSLNFEYLIPELAKNNKVEVVVLRNGVQLTVSVPVSNERSRVVPWSKNQKNDYAILGPLAFTSASQDLVLRMIRDQAYLTFLLAKESPLISRLNAWPAFDGERLVVVSKAFLNHPIISGFSNPTLNVVSQVNDQDVRNLRHLIELVRDAEGEFLEFTFDDNGEVLVFQREEFINATDDILESENIPHQFSSDLRDIWID